MKKNHFYFEFCVAACMLYISLHCIDFKQGFIHHIDYFEWLIPIGTIQLVHAFIMRSVFKSNKFMQKHIGIYLISSLFYLILLLGVFAMMSRIDSYIEIPIYYTILYILPHLFVLYLLYISYQSTKDIAA